MSDVFISYKREDEVRVVRLAKALENATFDVWWDRGLPGGESWRANIEAALEAARCVIVVWSKASVAKEGAFVRDEASRAMARGLLVPVLIDRVQLPLGFGEVQAIDLSHWKGSLRDPFFRDLAAAVRAKLDGCSPPKATGPTARLMRRLTFGSASSVVVAVVASIAFNTFGVSTKICTAAAMQPTLSDSCGMLGLDDRPTRAERLEWGARRPGSCEDLRAYIDHYHARGAYLMEANALLSARHVTTEHHDIPGRRYLALYERKDGTPAPNDSAARSAAIVRALADAQRLCQGFAATTLFKLSSTSVVPQNWNCSRSDSGVSCGFDGRAVCDLQVDATVERESCGRAR